MSHRYTVGEREELEEAERRRIEAEMLLILLGINMIQSATVTQTMRVDLDTSRV